MVQLFYNILKKYAKSITIPIEVFDEVIFCTFKSGSVVIHGKIPNSI